MNSGAAVEEPVRLPHPALPQADWADRWAATPAAPFATPRAAALAIVAAFPVWLAPLMALRNVMVRPFGLQTTHCKHVDSVGFFPVLDETPQFIVLGFNDRHLDFRLVLDSASDSERTAVTTLIRRHNLLGRLYLVLVLPFHRAILRSALGRACRNGRGEQV